MSGTRARNTLAGLGIVALALTVALGGVRSGANADEADARSLFKAMSAYMAAQKAISFEYDTNLEIVTRDSQKLTAPPGWSGRSEGRALRRR